MSSATTTSKTTSTTRSSKTRSSKTTSTKTSERPAERLALGLGGNLGDTEAIFLHALDELRRALGPLRVAPLYRSAPISPIPQADYLNTVAIAAAGALEPRAVLTLAKRLEAAAGRRRGARWSARPLDVDLLLFGDRQLDTPELVLPHPELRKRRFVLAPLADLEPAWRLPGDGLRVDRALAALGESQRIEKVGWRSPP